MKSNAAGLIYFSPIHTTRRIFSAIAEGEGTPTVIVVVYGNRAHDDAPSSNCGISPLRVARSLCHSPP